jgi:hypothetical protein
MRLDTSALASIGGTSGTVPTLQPTTPGSVTLPEEPVEGETITCSNPKCKREVPGARYGQKCPFCGVLWAQPNTDVIAKNGGPAGAGPDNGSNPFGKAPSPAGTAPAGGGVATAVKTPGGSTVTANTGFGIDSVPWWGKIAGFAGLMFVLWFMTQRR